MIDEKTKEELVKVTIQRMKDYGHSKKMAEEAGIAVGYAVRWVNEEFKQ